ncbi:MAG: cytochrome c3 family protein [Magnetococcales bacterium]|nr:cytochrome c3 family protein [Magnetococcales bacterium]
MFNNVLLAVLFLLLPIAPLWGGEKEATLKLTGPVATLACKMCHTWRKPVLESRVLKAPHNKIILNHGDGQLWCFSCHKADNPATLEGDKHSAVTFATPQKLCSTCHFSQVKSWRGGAHGKRTGSWQGVRTAWRCTACHNPHDPKILPFKPSPPPYRPGSNPFGMTPVDKMESNNG